MAECGSLFLCHENRVADRAVLALGQAGLLAGRCNCRIDGLGVAECGNGLLRGDDRVAGRAVAALGEACLCAGRRYSLIDNDAVAVYGSGRSVVGVFFTADAAPAVFEAVTGCRSLFLRGEYHTAGRAMAALGKACLCAGGRYGLIAHDSAGVHAEIGIAAAVGCPAKERSAVIVVQLYQIAAGHGKLFVYKFICFRNIFVGGIYGQELCKVCALELRDGLAFAVFDHGVRRDNTDSHIVLFRDNVALLDKSLAVETAVIVNVDTGIASAESADIAGGLVGNDLAACRVAVIVGTARLTDKAADVHLVVIGGVAVDIAECVAVIGRHAVIHAVEAARVGVVRVSSRGDLHVSAAVCHAAAHNTAAETARAAEALARCRDDLARHGAVIDKDAVLTRADEAADIGLVAGLNVDVNVPEVYILYGDGLLAAGGHGVCGVLAGGEAEQACRHHVGGRALAADGKAGDAVAAAVIIAAEGVCADLALLAVDLGVERPADRLPLAAEGDVCRLPEVYAAPAHVRVHGARQIAQLRLVCDEIGILSCAAAAGEFARVGCRVV